MFPFNYHHQGAYYLSLLKLYLLTNQLKYEGWNFNSGNYLFTTDTK